MIKSLIAISIVTLVHSWYPPACCSDTDCKPVPCDELVELDNGSIRYQSTVFTKDKIKPSEDNQCHVCRGASGTPYCVFTLMGA